MCKNKYCFDDACKGECQSDTRGDFIPNIDLNNPEAAKEFGRMPRKFWQCQNSACAKVVPNPLRWVEGAKTTFACPYCKNDTVEIQGQ